MFELFPFTNFHDLNLDWIIKKLDALEDGVKLVKEKALEVSADADYAEQFATLAAQSSQAAAISANDAEDSATAAHNSELAAGTSATNAHNSELAAGTSATNAHNSELAAGTSATNAHNSELAAAASETAAGNSATAAGTSATNAHNSELAAGTSATNAHNSELAAAASAAQFTWQTLVGGTNYTATAANTYERTPVTFTPDHSCIICVHCKYSSAAVLGLLVTAHNASRSDCLAHIESSINGGLELFFKANANTQYDVWVQFNNNTGTNKIYVYSFG